MESENILTPRTLQRKSTSVRILARPDRVCDNRIGRRRKGGGAVIRAKRTSERVIPEAVRSRDEYLNYLRHVFAYGHAKDLLDGCERVLDLGCGDGYGTRMLSEATGGIVGLDVDEDTVVRADEKHGSTACSFRCYDGSRIPFDDGTFDAAVSFQVIEHIHDDRTFIREAHRVLKTDGLFILTTPNASNRLRGGDKPWNRFHVREYSWEQLKELLGEVFSSVEVSGVTASEEVYELEMQRIAQSLRIVAWDRFDLRRWIPNCIKPLMTRVARSVAGRKNPDGEQGDWGNHYSLSDYSVTDDGVEDSLDLLTVCRK